MPKTANNVCRFCGERKPAMEFPPSKAIWFSNGLADICTACLENRVDSKDLNNVSKWLQYLDIPFYPNSWIDMYEDLGDSTITTYVLRFQAQTDRTDIADWRAVNDMWLEKLQSGKATQEIRVLNSDWIDKMKEKWGDYEPAEYERMEALYDDILHTQNITTSVQEDQVRKLCRLSLIIDKKIQADVDTSKDMKTYNEIIKSAGLEPKNSRSYGDFESVGELINYLVRKGYRPKFYDGKDNDMVDLVIKNMQAYLRRLVINEPNLPDMIQQRRDAYKIAAQLEEDGLENEELDNYEAQTAAVQYEDEGVDILDDYDGDST